MSSYKRETVRAKDKEIVRKELEIELEDYEDNNQPRPKEV